MEFVKESPARLGAKRKREREREREEEEEEEEESNWIEFG